MLANTFRLLAEQGKPGFYEGPVAEAIVEVVQSLGGYLSLEDLKQHGKLGSEITEAIPIRLKEHLVSTLSARRGSEQIDLWEHPPNGQGIVAQMALGILQELETQGRIPSFKQEDHNSAKYISILPGFFSNLQPLMPFQISPRPHPSPPHRLRRR